MATNATGKMPDPIETPVPEKPHMPLKNAVLLGTVSLIVLLGGLLYFLGFFNALDLWQFKDHDELARGAAQLVGEGRFEEAVAQAERVDRESNGTNFAARSVVDSGKFMTGDQEKRIEAIRYTKETYAKLEGQPHDQALQVNKLLGYVNAGFEQYVFDEIFSGDTFGAFLVKGDMGSSIRKLAEHSLSLSPTTEAAFRIGQWDADRIRDLYGTWNATAAQKELYADDILQIIKASDALIESEKGGVDGRPFDYMVEPRSLYWKSYLYGVVARVRPEYLDESKAELDKLVAIYEKSGDANGKKNVLIAARLPYGYFSYALAVHEVKGAAGKSEAIANLDAMMALIAENPGAHDGAYLSFVRGGGARSRADQERSYNGYLVFAEMHPPFKVFLQQYGWKFEN